MNCSRVGVLIPFSRSVVLSRIACLLFTTTSTSRCHISITIHCASTIVYTFVACCTFNCTCMDNCYYFTTTFPPLASFYIVCASTKCYSSTLVSFDSSMHTGSTDVTYGLICSFAHQCCLLLCKNSTPNVIVVSMF
jgi:hypothetical protein